MGAGIAQVAALAGHAVRLYDARTDAARAAIERIQANLGQLAQTGKIPGDRANCACAKLSIIDSLEGFSGCSLIVEAIVEDLEAKRALFRDVEKHISAQAILATNTSSISITAIAAALQQPQRLAGMHFFNPAPIMPLVEIVSGAATSPDITDALYATARLWGKMPVRTRSTPGFIVNRVARPFYAEALRVLQEHAADCATIDAVMRESAGFRMGPFELMDLIGNDVNHAVTRSVFDGFCGDPRFTPSPLQLELIRAGHLGRKTGRGFYVYDTGEPDPKPSTAVPSSLPSHIEVFGESPFAMTLAERLQASATGFERVTTHGDERIAACDQCVLYRTDGRTATARAATNHVCNTVVIDLALDDRTATRAAIAAADQADQAGLASASGLLQAAGYAVSFIDDIPGMIVMRTVAMLANEAADAVNQGVASVADLDLAMRKGVNYPRGPLEWADALGIDNIVQVLDNLAAAYGEDRYRVSPLLRRKALAGLRFTERDAEQESTGQNTAAYEAVRG